MPSLIAHHTTDTLSTPLHQPMLLISRLHSTGPAVVEAGLSWSDCSRTLLEREGDASALLRGTVSTLQLTVTK